MQTISVKTYIVIENKLIFFQTLYWQKREFPPVGYEPDASRLPSYVKVFQVKIMTAIGLSL